MRIRLLLMALAPAWPLVAAADPGTLPVPQHPIPGPVLLELRALENRFDLALRDDCAPERCVSKGCLYRDHLVVDQPRSSSLPGLGQAEGPGSVPAQEYLTQVLCQFAHEKTVSARDAQALIKRLEQRLSKGWLRVKVERETLEAVSPALRESPAQTPEPAPPATPEPVAGPSAPPPRWESAVALRELWLALLPHFAWMIAVVMGTLSILFVIWGLRRVGRESLEEKALAEQLAAKALGPAGEAGASLDAAPEAKPPALAPGASAEEQDASFVEKQRAQWADRVSHAELAKDEGGLLELLREWMRSGNFAMLAKAIFVFGDRLSLAFASDGELAVRKVEFADYLQNLDAEKLPSDAEFFRRLNHHAISSSLLAQSDAETYRSLREEFGSAGVAHLIERLPPRHGALLFALAPAEVQHEVAQLLSAELRLELASQLLRSNRMGRGEQAHLFSALDAARSGRPLPAAPAAAHGILDLGRRVDAAGALSVLLALLETQDRRALLASSLQRSSGAIPGWYEEILFPDMLEKLTPELRADLLLDVDIGGLAAWSSVQTPAFRERFLSSVAPTLQSAVRARMSFASRGDQMRLAQRGHEELVAALKRLAAQGRVTFAELMG